MSILDLSSSTDIGSLLFAMPIDILFNPDPNESHLKTIEMTHRVRCEYATTLNNFMNNFEQKYLQYKNKLKQQGLAIRSLQCVKHIQSTPIGASAASIVNPRYINSRHVWMKQMKVDLRNDKFLTNECNPGMNMISIESWINFVYDSNININIGNACTRGLNIKTMRLLSYETFYSCDICKNKVVIELLNLQNSLQNLTIEFVQRNMGAHDHPEIALINVLQKKHYYNLENVNIMFDNRNYTPDIDWLFKLLKENQKTLQNQFKQLNFAICKRSVHGTKCYFVFEWIGIKKLITKVWIN